MRLTLILILLLALASCTTTRYVPVEKVRDVHHHELTTDTVIEYQRDSVVIREKGDTIRELRWRWRDRWRTHIQHDTICKIDSVPYAVEVPAVLSRWQKIKIELGGWAFGVILAAIAALVVMVLRKKK